MAPSSAGQHPDYLAHYARCFPLAYTFIMVFLGVAAVVMDWQKKRWHDFLADVIFVLIVMRCMQVTLSDAPKPVLLQLVYAALHIVIGFYVSSDYIFKSFGEQVRSFSFMVPAMGLVASILLIGIINHDDRVQQPAPTKFEADEEAPAQNILSERELSPEHKDVQYVNLLGSEPVERQTSGKSSLTEPLLDKGSVPHLEADDVQYAVPPLFTGPPEQETSGQHLPTDHLLARDLHTCEADDAGSAPEAQDDVPHKFVSHVIISPPVKEHLLEQDSHACDAGSDLQAQDEHEPHPVPVGEAKHDDAPHPFVVVAEPVEKQTSDTPSLSQPMLDEAVHASGTGSSPEAKDEKQLHANLLSEEAFLAQAQTGWYAPSTGSASEAKDDDMQHTKVSDDTKVCDADLDEQESVAKQVSGEPLVEHVSHTPGHETASEMKGLAAEAVDGVEHAAESTAHGVEHAAESAAHGVEHAAESAAHSVASMARGLLHGAEDLEHKMGGLVHEKREAEDAERSHAKELPEEVPTEQETSHTPGLSEEVAIERQTSGKSALSVQAHSGTCPEGHQLAKEQTDSDGWSCSECHTEFPQGATLYGCRDCDYDVCRECIGTKAY